MTTLSIVNHKCHIRKSEQSSLNGLGPTACSYGQVLSPGFKQDMAKLFFYYLTDSWFQELRVLKRYKERKRKLMVIN